MTHKPPSGFKRRLFLQPFVGEFVIAGEIAELVPIVIDGIDQRMISAKDRHQAADYSGSAKDRVHAARGELAHILDTVAQQNLVERKRDDFVLGLGVLMGAFVCFGFK